MSILNKIHDWISKRKQDELLQKHGGLQWCPWCKQCMQDHTYSIQPFNENKLFDEFICGNCHGTSVWHFAMGFIYLFANHPPIPDKGNYNRIQSGKANYVGAPAIFTLDEQCSIINECFEGFGCYLVGSSLVTPNWRDVDIRFMMPDDEFEKLFPEISMHWEFDPRWILLTTSISERLSRITGLPVDFQFQPQTQANKIHKGARHAIGMRIK